MISLATLFVSAALALQAPSYAPPAPPPGDKVVATIDGHPILAKEVEPYLWDWKADQVVQDLISADLIKRAAEKRGVHVTDAEVDQEIRTQLQQFEATLPKGTTVAQALHQRGTGPSHIPINVRSQLLLEKIALADFKPDLYVKVATLVILPKSRSLTDLQPAITLANAAYASLQKGTPWANAIQQYATNPAAMQANGELGWIPIDALPAETRAELPTVKVNGYSKPVQTNNGLQIFKVEAQGKDATPAELAQFKQMYTHSAIPQIFAQLRKDAKIELNY